MQGQGCEQESYTEGAMSDRDMPTQSAGTDSADAPEQRQAPRLSSEEIERLENFEDLESLIEEPPDGSLSIISDQDVPGAPG
jgi:hypothetical protein